MYVCYILHIREIAKLFHKYALFCGFDNVLIIYIYSKLINASQYVHADVTKRQASKNHLKRRSSQACGTYSPFGPLKQFKMSGMEWHYLGYPQIFKFTICWIYVLCWSIFNTMPFKIQLMLAKQQDPPSPILPFLWVGFQPSAYGWFMTLLYRR